ncbi:MAG: hypothetical protein U0325_32030 [Polyangiales bacterium]
MRAAASRSHDRVDARPQEDTRTARFFALTSRSRSRCKLLALLAKLAVIPGPDEKYLPLVGLGALGLMLARALALVGARRRPGVRSPSTASRRGELAGWYVLRSYCLEFC